MPKPISKMEFDLANSLNKRFGGQMMDFADANADESNNDYQVAKGIVDETHHILSQYEKENRKVDEQGKLTAPPVTRSPAEVISTPDTGFDYHFEPSIAEAQAAFQSDPKLAVKLGLGPEWTTAIAVPEHPQDVTDPTSGMVMGTAPVPAQSHLDTLEKNDNPKNPYNLYREHLWKQRSDEAKAEGHNLKRYQDIHLNKNQWPDFLLGGLRYNIDRRLVPLQVDLANGMTMHTAGPAIDYANRKVSELLGTKRPPTTDEVRRRSPGFALLGELGSYALPMNPTNLIQEGVSNAASRWAGKEVLESGALGVASKAGIATAAGGVSNAAEGAAGDTARGLEQGQNLRQALGNAGSNVGFNAAAGGIPSAGLDLFGQGLGALRTSARRSPMLQDLKTNEAAGGRSDAAWGVVQGPDMERYFKQQDMPGEPRKANAIAAQEVLPQVRENMVKVSKEARERIRTQLEEYYNHPVYGAIKVDSKPLVDELLSMAHARKGSVGPISGKSKPPRPDQMRKIGDEIDRIADVHWVPAEEAQAAASQYNAAIIDDEFAHAFLDTTDAKPGYVAIAAAPPINARTLELHEEAIDDALGFARRQGTSKDDPVFRSMNKTIKSIRDKFPYYVDKDGKLVDPPSGMNFGAPGPSGMPPPTGPGSATPPTEGFRSQHGSNVMDPEAAWRDSPGAQRQGGQQDATTMVDANNLIDPSVSIRPPSSDADTIERMSEGEQRLSSSDFVPDTEDLASVDVQDVTPSTQELGSADFEPSTPAPRPTPRLRDLRRRAIPQGPQKGDYPDHNEYLMARARWRLEEGKATEADRARLKKAVGTIPPTQRVPASSAEAPTQRSVAPEDATPLSLLAGNEPFGSASPDESLPVPNAEQWDEAKGEAKDWYDDIVSPGRDPRSDEAKRMGDLTAQNQAFEEANVQIKDVENRLGEMEKDGRVQSILGIMSQKLGREVTIEDLVRAGLIGGGLAAASSDDKDVKQAGVLAMFGGNLFGHGKGWPRELEAKLDDGTVVKGLSALRHQQHNQLNEFERIHQASGVDRDQAIINHLTQYGQGTNPVSDEVLLKTAKEMGIEKELRNIAALTIYPRLRDKAFAGTGTQHFWSPTNFAGHRLDRVLQLLSGQKNPFRTSGPIEDATERLFNLTGGRPGARFANDAQRIYQMLYPQSDEQDKRRQEGQQ